MNPSKLAGNILKKIEEEKITPRSKYLFIAKNVAFWALFGLAVIIGTISFAIILYAAFNTDFEIGEFVEQESYPSYWLSLLPLLWVLLIGIAIGIGMVGLKHTKRGYRIALVTLVGGNIVTSIALGSGLYAAGGAEVIEEVLEERFEGYESVREKHQRFWGNPGHKGRLAGRVTGIDEDLKLITLECPKGNHYQIPYGEQSPIKEAPEVGQILKMKGRLYDDDRFEPERMRRAHRHERLQRRLEEFHRQNPELRAKTEAKLSAETKAELEEARAAGERPSRALNEKIRQEIRANTTKAEREALMEKIRDLSPKFTSENRPLRPIPPEIIRER